MLLSNLFLLELTCSLKPGHINIYSHTSKYQKESKKQFGNKEMGCPWTRPTRAETEIQELVDSINGLEVPSKNNGFVIPDSFYCDGKAKWSVVHNTRVLRIFMSSTFRDMQRERDEFFANAEKKYALP